MPTLAEYWMQQGREEGLEEGLLRGQVEGRIRVLLECLGQTPASSDELRQVELQQLLALEQQLRVQLQLPLHRD